MSSDPCITWIKEVKTIKWQTGTVPVVV